MIPLRTALVSALCGLQISACMPACAADDDVVKAVGDRTFAVSMRRGDAIQRYFGTASLDGSPAATRALIVIHGVLRNADLYERTGEEAVAAAGHAGVNTIVITPQFLTTNDVAKFRLPAATIRWGRASWSGGDPSDAPAPISAFTVLDRIVERLADRTRFPAMREVIVAGHSAGGQLVQRYAIVARVPDTLGAPAVRVRFVVSNPSSYLYFNGDRPSPSGFFAPVAAATCPDYDRWRYGFGGAPPYVSNDPATYERRFITRDVTYLLGENDIDPRDPYLATNCAAETQGAFRLARGRNFVRYLRARHPGGTSQHLDEVAGVGHDSEKMFTSPCGIAVLFDRSRTACAIDERV